MRRLLFIFIAIVATIVGVLQALGNDQVDLPSAQVSVAQDDARDTLDLSISLYLLVDDLENPNPQLSSQRTEAELREILAGMNEIWSQADVHLEERFIGTIAVPQDILIEVNRGNFGPFFNQAGVTFEVPQPAIINGFYGQQVGGANGIVPFAGRIRAYFVMDEPSVHDRRVSSHEVGHILGLHHTLESRDRLLFPGTNGMDLAEAEIIVSRYFAQGILDGVR